MNSQDHHQYHSRQHPSARAGGDNSAPASCPMQTTPTILTTPTGGFPGYGPLAPSSSSSSSARPPAGTGAAPTAVNRPNLASATKRKLPHPDDDAQGGGGFDMGIGAAAAGAGAGTADGGGAPGDAPGPVSAALGDKDKQSRSKRNRYVAIACNECKRRKIKCNGETPCQRCGHLNYECLYTPNCCNNNFRESEEYKTQSAQLRSLQEQVDSLFKKVTELQYGRPGEGRPGHEPSPVASSASASVAASSIPPQWRGDRHPSQPSIISSISNSTPASAGIPSPAMPAPYQGPSSTRFSLDVARQTMTSMGYSPVDGHAAAAQQQHHRVQEFRRPSIDALRRQQQLQQQQQQQQQQPTPRQTEPYYPENYRPEQDYPEPHHAQLQQRSVEPFSPAPLLPSHLSSTAPSPSGPPSDSLPPPERGAALAVYHHDPLFDFTLDEVIRLLKFYDDEIGIMYPFLSLAPLTERAHALFSAMEHGARRSVGPGGQFDDVDALTLKLVVCCSVAVEESQRIDRAQRLFASIEDRINRMFMSEPADPSRLQLLSLVAGYRWFSNDEKLGWRTIGHVMRLMQEMGLNTVAGLSSFPQGAKRDELLGTFWSMYTLDRRWAFSTGLPFALHNEDVDPNLPLPKSHPYLMAMVTYSRVAAKVWRFASDARSVLARDLRPEDIAALDREIQQWYDVQVPSDVQMRDWDKERALEMTSSYNLKRLRLWTYLRYNQIRIWLYTPILHSATSIMAHANYAERAVALARDTVRFLNNVNNSSDIYRRMQKFYHQFLTSSIAVLFLASVHAPVRFSAECRDEFYMALDLMRGLPSKSWVSQRLWKTVAELKDLMARLGMRQDDAQHHHQQHHLHPHHYRQQQPGHVNASPFSPSTAPSLAGLDTDNGLLLRTEMSRMFEGYVGYTTDGNDVALGGGGGGDELMGGGGGGMDGGHGGDDIAGIFWGLY